MVNCIILCELMIMYMVCVGLLLWLVEGVLILFCGVLIIFMVLLFLIFKDGFMNVVWVDWMNVVKVLLKLRLFLLLVVGLVICG